VSNHDHLAEAADGFLAREGILARWLAADSLSVLCREMYGALRESHGIARILIVAQRADCPIEWAMAPEDASTAAIEEWFETVSRRRSSRTAAPMGTGPESAGAASELVPPGELGLVADCRVDASPAVSYTIFCTRSAGDEEAGNLQACDPFKSALELVLCNLARLERVRELSHIDTLTQTFNRRHFNVRVTEEVDRARRYGRPLSLLIADLDGLKALNDSRGHQAGDIVLRYIAQTIRHTVRSIDILCRLGGDEFAILMPDTDQGRCQVLAERLRQTVAERAFTIGGLGDPVRLGLSLGGAVFPVHSDQPDRLLWCADMALLEAKRRSGDRVVFFDRSYCEHLKMPLGAADETT